MGSRRLARRELVLVKLCLRWLSQTSRSGRASTRQVVVLWDDGRESWSWSGHPTAVAWIERAQREGVPCHRQDDRGIWRYA